METGTVASAQRRVSGRAGRNEQSGWSKRSVVRRARRPASYAVSAGNSGSGSSPLRAWCSRRNWMTTGVGMSAALIEDGFL